MCLTDTEQRTVLQAIFIVCLSVCLCSTHSLVLPVVLNWYVEGNLTVLTDRVWGGTTGAGTAPTASKLPAATGCGIRINPLGAELNPIFYLLALLGAHHFLHVTRIRVKHLKP